MRERAAALFQRGVAGYVGRRQWGDDLLLALLIGAEAAVLSLVTAAIFGPGRTVGWPILFLLLLLSATLPRGRAALTLLLVLPVAIRLLAFSGGAPGDVDWVREAARGLVLRPNGAVRPLWGVVLLVIYAWWRGRTRDAPGSEVAYRLLRWGTVAALVALVAANRYLPLEAVVGGGVRLPGALYGAAAVFLGCTLAAIALAQLLSEQARGGLTLTPRWLGTFLAPVGLLLLIGVVLSGLSTGNLLETIAWLLTPLILLIELLQFVLLSLILGFAWLWVIASEWVRGGSTLLGSLGTPRANAPPAAPTPAAAATPGAVEAIGRVEIPDPARYLMALAILVALVWVVGQLLQRRRPDAPQSAGGEVRESVFRWSLLGAGLAGLFRRGRPPRRPDPLAHLRGDLRWRHTLAIRETYRRLLGRGVAAELPRAPGQTPDEYAPVLTGSLDTGDASEAVATLTARYDDARYSDRPASAEEAAAAAAAWETFTRAHRAPDRRP